MPSSLSELWLPSRSTAVRSSTASGQDNSVTGGSLTHVTLTVTFLTSSYTPSVTRRLNSSVSPAGYAVLGASKEAVAVSAPPRTTEVPDTCVH